MDEGIREKAEERLLESLAAAGLSRRTFYLGAKVPPFIRVYVLPPNALLALAL
jgi:hypothetical protein